MGQGKFLFCFVYWLFFKHGRNYSAFFLTGKNGQLVGDSKRRKNWFLHLSRQGRKVVYK